MCVGVQQSDLKINTFYLRLYRTREPVPDTLTLCYLPRINGSPLQINGSWIRPDIPGFVTLHRFVSGSGQFGSRERVRVSEGTRFEVYLGEDKLVRGIFREDEEEWRMEVKCVVLEREAAAAGEAVEVCVTAEGEREMREKVAVMVRRRRQMKYYNNNYYYKSCNLEEIPEQREGDVAESDGWCCCCCADEERRSDESEGGDEVVKMEQGVTWAVDVGIWVLCLGLAFFLTKPSTSKTLRPNILS